MPNTQGDRPHNQGYDYIELVGRQVRLRPTVATDAQRAFEYTWKNDQILKWLFWKGPMGKAELAETLGAKWPVEMQAGTKYSLAIEEVGQPGLIGVIDARIERYARQLEVGYWLGVPYWRKGYMAEAVGLICHFCFHHLKAEVVQGGAFAGNHASRRVMEKAGFNFEGTLRRELCKDEKWIDLWHLAILREEWEARHFKPVSEKLTKH
jgi:[ribosomal protein S5]-alanine N-acetyltransferase